jgi:spectinomycin phosphotransferase
VMLDTAGTLWIVDWDETMLAPRERDLMFVVGGIGAGLVQPHEEAWFLEGYGPTNIDPLALAYYRYNWAIGDIGLYAEQVFLEPDVGELTKRNAVQAVMSCFGPGNIVDLAYTADPAADAGPATPAH